MNDVTSKGIEAAQATAITSVAKPKWEKPEVIDFQPITVSRGVSNIVGDGISNLT